MLEIQNVFLPVVELICSWYTAEHVDNLMRTYTQRLNRGKQECFVAPF